MSHKLLFLLVLFTIISCKEQEGSHDSQNKKPIDNTLSIAETIAYKNGFEHWKNVEEIKFTFNVERNNNHSERSWIFRPKSQEVTLISSLDTLSYNRNTMDSIALRADAAFINDKYWLLAPFNLIWDQGISFDLKENVSAPISKDTLNQLTVSYGDHGGYTPGDAYDFFYGKDFLIKEWIFRKGNDSVPTMITTWEDYETFKKIKISKMHRDSTGNLKLFFTNISVN